MLLIKLPIQAELGSLSVYSKFNTYKCQERYAYILGIIFYKNKIAGHSQNTGVELSSAVLRNLFGGIYNFYIKNLIDAEYIVPVNAPYSYDIITPNGNKQTLHCKGMYQMTKVSDNKEGTKQIFKGHSKRYKLNTKFFGIKPKLKDFEIRNPILIDKLNTVQSQYSKKVLENFPAARKQEKAIKSISIRPEVWEFLNLQYPINDLVSLTKYLFKNLGSKEQVIRFLKTLKNNRLTTKNITGIMKSFGLNPNHKFYDYTFVDSAIRLYFKRKYRSLIISKIEDVQNGNHDFLRFAYDSKTNRLFTLITETPKDIMPFLKMDNESLVEIDGNNTQWSTTVSYLKRVFRLGAYYKLAYEALDLELKQAKKAKEYYKIKPITFDTIHEYVFIKNRINLKKEFKNLHLLGEIQYKGEIHLNRYLKEMFLRSNRWYKRLADELDNMLFAMNTNSFRDDILNLIKNISPNYPQDKIKKDLFGWVLFGPSPFPYYKDNTVVKAFRMRYSATLLAIETLKNRGFNHTDFGYSSIDRWKLLSVINQKKEASIFVLDATANIEESFLTKHDALYVKLSDSDSVYRKMQLILKKHHSSLEVSQSNVYDPYWRNSIKKQEYFIKDPNKVIELSAKLNKYNKMLQNVG